MSRFYHFNVREYLFALAVSVLGLLITYHSWPWLGELVFLVVILLAIVVTWLGGWKSGLLSVLFFTAGFNLIFLQLNGHLDLEDAPTEGILLVASMLLGVAAAERWRAQDAVNHLTALADSSDDAIIGTRLDGTITSWNSGAERMYGYTGVEVKNRSITMLTPPDQVDEFQVLQVKWSRGEKIERLETTRMRRDGTRFFVSLTSVSVRDWRGRIQGVSTIQRDVTERVLAYQLLQQRVANRTRELSALYDVTAVSSSSLDVNVILEKSLDRILDVMDSDTGTVQILQDDGGLHLTHSRGIPPQIISQLDWVRSDRGLAGSILRSNQPVVIPDTVSDPRTYPPALKLGSKAFAGVPIRAKSKALGVLIILREPEHPFDAEQIQLLASIGAQLGVAVENARLFAKAEEKGILEERQRLARELHDSVAQSLYGVVLLAESARHWISARESTRAEKEILRLDEIAHQVLKEMRLMLYEFRPMTWVNECLADALEQRLEAVERRSGMSARLLVEGVIDLEPEMEEKLFLITREALNNSLQHAQASEVIVRITASDGQVEFVVEDNGRGFDPESSRKKGSWGMGGMRQRAEELGGRLSIDSSPGKGTRVRVTVNARRPHHEAHQLLSSDTAEAPR